MQDEHGNREFAAAGTVVEIFERGGERFVRVLAGGGAVLEVPAGSIEVGEGDRVAIDASLHIVHVSRPAEPPQPMPPNTTPEAASGPEERRSARDYEHVVRMAALFALGITAFLVWRSWMVPSDFGVYGHYRAGAVEAAALRPSHYAGQATCVECHTDVQEVRSAGRHANVACEACHGPLGAHANGETDVAPIRPSPRAVCLTCHTARLGMPATFPKIVVNEHSEAGPCTECHAAHAPSITQTSRAVELFRPRGPTRATPPAVTWLLETAAANPGANRSEPSPRSLPYLVWPVN
jgi:hypothetical protein